MRLTWWLVSLLALWICRAAADESSHQYKSGETVVLWMNNVGPNANPQETYSYSSKPFCRPNEKTLTIKSDTFGALLEDSGILIQFQQDREKTTLCELVMTDDAVRIFTDDVKKLYLYQMYLDELPIWGLFGEYSLGDTSPDTPSSVAYIYTHRRMDVTYNGDRIIQVTLTPDNLEPIVSGRTYPFTFEIHWKPTEETFESRFDHYLDSEFFEHQIHWFSIFNSFMMVLFLCGLVALIVMRTLRNDYARYSLDDDAFDLDTVNDESGWKQVHSDVFRAPPYLSTMAMLLGAGSQLFCMFAMVCLVSITGHVYRWRGALLTNMLIAWVLTSFVGGYASASFYKRHRGFRWKRVFLMTWAVIPGVVTAVLSFLNVVAITYSSTAAIPFSVMASIFALWLFLCGPLHLVGTLVGRNLTQVGDFPCRVSNLRRPIPLGPWYLNPAILALVAGILPFGSIFIEMHFVLTAFWNYKFYYVYGFLLLVFAILTFVTMSVTVVFTYFKLNNEDYRWQWMAFGAGASTGLYTFLYTCYYFIFKTQMTGMFQTLFYFTYSFLLASGVSCLCAAVSFTGASLFVNRIYKDIKSD